MYEVLVSSAFNLSNRNKGFFLNLDSTLSTEAWHNQYVHISSFNISIIIMNTDFIFGMQILGFLDFCSRQY